MIGADVAAQVQYTGRSGKRGRDSSRVVNTLSSALGAAFTGKTIIVIKMSPINSTLVRLQNPKNSHQSPLYYLSNIFKICHLVAIATSYYRRRLYVVE